MRIRSVNEDAGLAQLDALKRGRNLVLLVGSAVSGWKPTGVPPGQAVVEQLAQRLVPDREPAGPLLSSIVARNAFEHIFERCPDHASVREWIAAEFRGGAPNGLHLAVARLLADGVVRHVITTNYDLAFEQAFSRIGVPVHRVVGPEDCTADGQSMLFKIHGSADRPKSLVFALRHESEMPSWKRDLLRRLLDGNDLFVSGYSGTDFELCPELAALAPSCVVWNSREDPQRIPAALRPNAKRVVDTVHGVVVWGDMRTCWRRITGTPIDLEWEGSPGGEVVDRLFARLSPGDVVLWQAALMNGIGAGRAAASALAAMTPSPPQTVSRRVPSESARSLFHRGQYHSAALAFEACAEQQVGQGQKLDARYTLLSAADAWRCYGNWSRASRITEDVCASSPDDSKLIGAVDRIRVLLIRHKKDLAELLLRRRAAERLRQQAIPRLRRAFEAAKEAGNWHDIQMCRMWCERLGIDVDQMAGGAFVPLASGDGWMQIGYVVAEWMALRDEAARHPTDQTVWRKLEPALRDALAVGSHPEAWKIAAVLCSRRRSFRLDLVATGIREFCACEYSAAFRLFSTARTLYAAVHARRGVLPGL